MQREEMALVHFQSGDFDTNPQILFVLCPTPRMPQPMKLPRLTVLKQTMIDAKALFHSNLG